MKLLDVAAVVGALAWTPYIIGLVRNWLLKPEVTIITGSNPELGFTSFGPIFNLHIAFAVKYKDTVISNLVIKVKHENGEEKVFNWRSIKQEMFRSYGLDGVNVPHQKEQSVLALKLNQSGIEERFIQFQEPDFYNEQNLKIQAYNEKAAYLSRNNPIGSEEFIECAEMENLIQFTQQAFAWKTGKYVVTIEVESPEQFKLKGNRYEFSLSSIDVSRLDANKNSVRQYYKGHFPPKEDEETNPIVWNWVYPLLAKKNG